MEYKSKIYTLDNTLGNYKSTTSGAVINSVISDNVKRCGGIPSKHQITILPYPEEDIPISLKGKENEPKWSFQVITEFN